MTTILTKKTRLELSEILMDIKLRHTTINYGGCGIFALTLGKVLKSLNYDIQYIIILKGVLSLEQANNGIRINDIKEVYETNWTHIVVKVGNEFIDIDGIRENIVRYYEVHYSDPLSEEFLDKMVSDKGNWNPLFDREEMKIIEKKLKILTWKFGN